jgi:hypothetical protein
VQRFKSLKTRFLSIGRAAQIFLKSSIDDNRDEDYHFLMFKRLAALAVILTATAGFGASTAWSETKQPKPACCKPAHCGAQFAKPGCCRPDADSRPQVPVSPTVKAPETSAPIMTLVATMDAGKSFVSLEFFPVPSAFSTAPPLFSLKSSFLI